VEAQLEVYEGQSHARYLFGDSLPETAVGFGEIAGPNPAMPRAGISDAGWSVARKVAGRRGHASPNPCYDHAARRLLSETLVFVFQLLVRTSLFTMA